MEKSVHSGPLLGTADLQGTVKGQDVMVKKPGHFLQMVDSKYTGTTVQPCALWYEQKGSPAT